MAQKVASTKCKNCYCVITYELISQIAFKNVLKDLDGENLNTAERKSRRADMSIMM